MASNLAVTVLNDHIAMHQPQLDKYEQRGSIYGALDLFRKQTNDPISILDAETRANIDRSFSIPVRVPVINFKDITIGNARSCSFQTEGIVSARVTLTFITYTWGFTMQPVQHHENYVPYQTTFNKLALAGYQKAASTIDAQCVTTLNTQKNQHFPQSVLDFYPQVSNFFRVPQVDSNDLYNNIRSILETMDYDGGADIANNHIHQSKVRRLASQGAGNSENEMFQFMGYQWFGTNRITNASVAEESTIYAVSPGTVAIHSRVDPDSANRRRIHESQFWDVIPNPPLIEMPVGVYYQANCADLSANVAGASSAMQESWQFSTDVVYMTAYNSDLANRFNPILGFQILA